MTSPDRIALGAVVVVVLAGSCKREVEFDVRDAAADGGGTTRPPPCTDDTGCGLESLYCDVDDGTCVECLEDEDCERPGMPRCDPGEYRCVQCLAGGTDCGAGEACKAGHCVETCGSGLDCGGEVECEGEPPQCEWCERVNPCSGTPETPVCDRRVQGCVECAVDGDCTDDASPHCEPMSGTCVECADSSHCPAARPWCDPATHACVSG